MKGNGFLKLLTDVNKLKTLCFIADLGYIYSRFQKQIQSDDILLFYIVEKRDTLIKLIEGLRKSPLIGGWESVLTEQIALCNINLRLLNYLTKLDQRIKEIKFTIYMFLHIDLT